MQYLPNEKHSTINVVVFEVILTYSLPRIPFLIIMLQNKVLNKQNFQDGFPIFHRKWFPTIFLRHALKFNMLSTASPFTNVLFCSKVGVIRNELFVAVFF